jgi:hypothetical protein
VECPQAEQLTTRFFSEIGFRGFGSMEFKRHPDGRLLLIEPTIGRIDVQIGLADLNGVPISYLAYCDLTGLPLPAMHATQKKVKWVEFRADRRAAKRHVAKGELTWLDWLGSIRPPVGWAVWSLDDPAPWFADVFGRLGHRVGKALGRLSRKRPPALSARWRNSSAAKPIETICGGAVGIVQATPDDVDCILDLLAQAGRWLLAKGIRQWPNPPPRKWVLKRVERGEFFLAREQEKVIATFRLNGFDEDGLWGTPPAEAAYLGKLAILRTVAGRRVGLELLRAAEGMVVSAGRALLRLDCWSKNEFLCDYYARAGFQKCGTRVQGEYSVCLFQKKLG